MASTEFEPYYDLTLPRVSGMLHKNKLSRVLYNLSIASIFVLGFISCIVQVVIKGKEGNNMLVLVENLHWSLVHLLMLTFCLRTWLRTGDFFHMGNMIKSGIYTYGTELEPEALQILQEGNQQIKRFIRCFFGAAWCAFVVATFRDPVFGGSIEEEGSQVTIRKLFDTWFPFQVNTWPRYVGVSIFHLALASAIVFHSSSNVILVTTCAIHVLTQLKLLKRKIQDSHYSALKKSDNRKTYEKVLYAYLCENIQHHLALIRFFQIFQKVYSLNFLTSYFGCGFILCAVGYMVTGPDSNIRSSLAFIVVVGAELIFIGGYCYYGQQIIDESSSIRDVVYDLPWYDQPKKICMLYQMIFIRCKFPLTPSAYGLKSMCFSTFGEVLHASYSYFNVLFAARSN